ncbi:HTH_38 domain-containing protein [Trichonephila clavipes]|nr:HTH_38 domain-containing protein [Trichonephila clavipes]
MSRRSAFDQVSEFDRGRIVAYRDCGLFFRQIGSRVGQNQTIVTRIYDRWMQGGYDGPTWSIESTSVHHFTLRVLLIQLSCNGLATTGLFGQHILVVLPSRTPRYRLIFSPFQLYRPIATLFPRYHGTALSARS